MTDQADVADAARQQSVKPVTPQKRHWFSKLLAWMLIAFFVMQLVMWSVTEPIVGAWLFNTITYAQLALSTICVLVWWFLFSPYSRRTVWAIGLPVVVLIFCWLASIREVDVYGDMNMDIQYRWEKSNQQVLDEYRESVEVAPVANLKIPDEISPESLTAYRGIQRDGVVVSPPLRTNWNENPPIELWRHPIGGGYSSFAVLDPVLVTMEQRGGDEAVVCYEIESGKEFWEHHYPASFNALGGPGPRSTPTIHEKRVYSYGCFGDLHCLDLETGKPIWHVNVLQLFGLPTTHWGMTSSPLIHEDKVIVTTGGLLDGRDEEKLANGIVAFRLLNGELVWHSDGIGDPNVELTSFKTGQEAIMGIPGFTIPGYSSPMLAELAGETVILNFDGNAFHGHDPQTGKLLWPSFPFVAGEHINVAQPIVLPNDRVLISSGYGTGSMLLQISQEAGQWKCAPVWEQASTKLRCKFSSPILYEGYVYGLDEGRMVCFDPNTGERLWNGGRSGLRGKYGHGQLMLADHHLIVLTETGELICIDPNPEELTVTGMLKVLSDDVKTWNPLAIAHGKVFVRNASEVACYDLRAVPPADDSVNEIATIGDESGTEVTEIPAAQ